ncbi:hypothetical protein EDM68_01835 [Candidatus Uhrbacteria bacterium]|nr:MAG: hypothetical protein EDM68_01835 [Candidatus Uhrbacteria bacterium]
MNAINLPTGPSSWDRDMQGLDEDPESENLAALGMHLIGNDEEEDEEEEESKEGEPEEEKDEEEDEPEELDELKELDRLEKELKEEDPAVLVDEEE